MQLPYNSPGGYLVHVLISQCVYVPINGPGRSSGKPRYVEKMEKRRTHFHQRRDGRYVGGGNMHCAIPNHRKVMKAEHSQPSPQ